jgi:hypothetical protein
MIMTLLVIVYYITYKPFNNEFHNKLELFNEFTILAASYHLSILTSFVDDPYIQYNVGFSIIAFTLLNLLVNSFIMIVYDFKVLFFKVVNFIENRIIAKIKEKFRNKLRTVAVLNTTVN